MNVIATNHYEIIPYPKLTKNKLVAALVLEIFVVLSFFSRHEVAQMNFRLAFLMI